VSIQSTVGKAASDDSTNSSNLKTTTEHNYNQVYQSSYLYIHIYRKSRTEQDSIPLADPPGCEPRGRANEPRELRQRKRARDRSRCDVEPPRDKCNKGVRPPEGGVHVQLGQEDHQQGQFGERRLGHRLHD
jgi:hypothetical protein